MKKDIPVRCFIFLIIVFTISCSIYRNPYKTGYVLTLQPGPEEGIDAYIENWPGNNYPNRNWGIMMLIRQ